MGLAGWARLVTGLLAEKVSDILPDGKPQFSKNNKFNIKSANLGSPPLTQQCQVEHLHFLPRPGRTTQELETGSDAGINVKAADIDLLPKFGPAVMLDQFGQHLGQSHSMQGIVRLGRLHADQRLRDFGKGLRWRCPGRA